MQKVALITGSTSGIGLGIARCFAKAGYNIAFNGLEANGAEIAAAVGKEFGIKTTFSPANLMKPDAIQAMVAEAEQAFGQIDVLINNAGVQFVSPVEDFPIEKWDLIIGVNMSAVFHTSHGLRASEFKSAYVTSKHGVTGLTKVLGLEGAPYGITCNAICPGYVRTPLVEGQIKDQAKAHNMSEEEVIEKVMLKKQAIKEFVKLETLGELALFLASETASEITGTSIPVDGGWTAQ
jgi:3-hydroxybutyrate dehydrogenase